MLPNLTIAIPVQNEEKNLPGCLDAIGTNFAGSIIIIDSNSTDRTIQIAEERGITVLQFAWNGSYPKKRNWFLQNFNLQTEWILFLDADEYVTELFKKELRKKLLEEKHVGYILRYSNYFMGKQLKGGYPLKKLALFRVGYGQYEVIPENSWSKLDMEVHERPILSGSVGIIKQKIDHREIKGISHYLSKHAEYASWEARRFLEFTSNVKRSSQWTITQKFKYRIMGSVWAGPIYFIGSLFLYGGLRDGKRGIAFAIAKMSYFNQIYCRIKELKSNV